MRGAQGPGGPRGRTAPERFRSGVYARRRILAILVVLLLIALLVPRTCQALLGSGEDAGSSQDRQAGAGGAANEDGAQEGALEEGATEDAGDADAGGTDAGGTDAEKSEDDDRSEGDDPSSRGAPFVDDEPGDGGASGTEDGDEAAPDLAAMMTTELAVIGGEIPAAGDGQSSGAGAPNPPETGGEPPADEHPMSETQFALAASPTPAEQPANTRRAPSTESEPAERAAPRAKAKRAPRAAEWGSGRLDLTPPTLAVSRAGPAERGARRTRIEPVLAEPAEPVLAEPAEPVLAEPPAPIPHDRAFVGNPRSGVARGVPRGVANNFGGNAAGALHGAPAFNRAVAAPRLPAVPRAAPAAATWGAGAAAAARPVAF
jgi:hypothetical protein